MKISYKKLRLFAVIYAVLPIIVFYIGWLTPTAALIFSAVAVSGVFFFVKDSGDGEYSFVNTDVKQVITAAAIALIWCFLAGQGGFIHQSSDHIIRNAIFRDLIRLPWPVVYEGDQLLSYYIAHWMIPSAVGKAVLALSGSEGAGFLAGRVALFIWSSAGIFIALMLVSVMTAANKKANVLISSLLFIFFSGLDVIGSVIYNCIGSLHLEWWAEFSQFSSFTTCLFFVYNQFIVSLIMTLCILNEKEPVNFAFLGILILPYGPFPFLGIVMICMIKAIVFLTEKYRQNMLAGGIRRIFSLQNIIMILAVGLPYGAYYMSNAIISNDVYKDGEIINTGFRFHTELAEYISDGSTANIAAFLARYLLFIILEAGIHFVIILLYHKKTHHKDIVFIISSAALLVMPLFQIGIAYDFAMRVSLPVLIYMGIEFIRLIIAELPPKGSYKNLREVINAKPLLAIAALVFLFGAVTPVFEFEREILKTFEDGPETEESFDYIYSLNDFDQKENFAAPNYKESLFYDHLIKK